MALPNPTINPPLLFHSSSTHSRPAHRRLLSRSPSRSPVRQRFNDPLLRDLSPTSTIRAFANDHEGKNTSSSFNFEAVSQAERAFGAQAAQACLDLRSWVRELEAWEWPGTFEQTDWAQEEEREEYWGSLPSHLVQSYDRRADDIARERDTLDLEEMKRFVLAAHGQSGASSSRSNSLTSISGYADLRHLDDFTALLTATILQALPFLARLTRLLDVWTIRLMILRQAGVFLADLEQAKQDLEQAWTALTKPSQPNLEAGSEDPGLIYTSFLDTKQTISRQVSSLGRRLDAFLDQLEGSQEVVPDSWIDDFEGLEARYGEWVVQAEQKVLEDEWRLSRGMEARERDAEAAQGFEAAGEQASDGDAASDHNLMTVPVSLPASGFMDLRTDQTPSRAVPTPVILSELPDNGTERPRDDSLTLPPNDSEQVQHATQSIVQSSESYMPFEQPPKSPTKRSRHVPIVIDYNDHPSMIPQSTSENNNISKSFIPDLPPVPSLPQAHSDSSLLTNSVAARKAAFAKRQVEQAESLQRQVKSPVRPFEHASNAFTRLFRNRERTPESGNSRSSSMKSNGSGREYTPASAKEKDFARSTGKSGDGLRSRSGSKLSLGQGEKAEKGDGVIWGGRPAAASPTKGPSAPLAAKDSRPDLRTMSQHRSRSGSHRSLSRRQSSSSAAGAVVDAVPVSLPQLPQGPWQRQRMPARERSYTDMPGGFRPRAKSTASARSPDELGRAKSYTSQERRLEGVNKIEEMKKVETYQPTRRDPNAAVRRQPSGGMREPEYPADWPLASPPDTQANSPVKETPGNATPAADNEDDTVGGQNASDSSPEIHSPRLPMQSDAFDRMFVESLPTSPDPEFDSRRKETEGFRSARSSQQLPRPAERPVLVPTLSEDMLDPAPPRPMDMFDLGLDTPGDQGKVSAGENPDVESSKPLKQAESHDYFPLVSTTNQPDDADVMPGLSSPDLRSSARSPSLKLQIPDLQEQVQAEAGETARPMVMHRASMASIESHPRSALRSIEVPSPRSAKRNSQMSISGFRSPPQTPHDSAPVSALEPTGFQAGSMPGSPLMYKGMVTFPSPPMAQGAFAASPSMAQVQQRGKGRERSPVSPLGSRAHSPVKSPLAIATNREDSPVSSRSSSGEPQALSTPLNAAMGKRGNKARPQRDETTTPVKPASRDGPNKAAGGDNFDRHVSDVLDRLPSHSIKFRARPGAKTPDSHKRPTPGGAPRPKANGRLFSRGNGDITIAPADASPKKSAEEVKVYHLTQAGREEPIKLFVRLVGENERVMVRVGGGWADLADYLRMYAEHHGSRTVSGGGLELQTVDSRKVSTSSVGRGRPGTPTGAGAGGTPNLARKRSDASLFKQEFAGSDSGSGSLDEGENAAPLVLHTATTSNVTPRPSSRPGTATSVGRPGTANSHRYSDFYTPGSLPATSSSLAGPASNSKNGTELDDQKAKWVEGMLEKAKAANSAEKPKGLAEIGKAGSTRRVIFKKGSTATLGGGEKREVQK